MAPLQPLADILPLVVAVDLATGAPCLLRPVSREVVGALQGALALARGHASEHVVRVAEAVAANMQVGACRLYTVECACVHVCVRCVVGRCMWVKEG